jgi:hypothetical protein
MKIRCDWMTAFATVVVILLLPAAALATVEPNWPVGTPNQCRNASDGFMSFEQGVDGAQIKSTIPGLMFTTTAGIDWAYADKRTGAYNVNPYGSGAYETNGDFFAWLGVAGDQGLVTMIGGEATYVSVLVSTASGLALDAYDAAGNFLATSGFASDNVNTGTMTRLTVEATGIAYVQMHDTGNFWLMDDLCTDAPPPCQPVPGYTTDAHAGHIDLVFVPDADYGGNMAAFLADVGANITQRLGAVTPINSHLGDFNFYFTALPGDVTNGTCGASTLPANLLSLCPYADAVVVLHQGTRTDCTSWSGQTGVFGAEGTVGRSFIHEGGHAMFGLRDEYASDRDPNPSCNYTSYDSSRSLPSNIWDTQADCRLDAQSQGWDPNQCYMYTACQGDWWKLGDPSLANDAARYADASSRFIMFDGTYFANGFGAASERAIDAAFNRLPEAPAPPLPPPSPEKSIVLDLEIDETGLTLVDSSFVVAAPPDSLPGEYALTATTFSTHGNLLAARGFADPRSILGEQGYPGPAMLAQANFTLVLPYFDRGGLVEVRDGSGTLLLSADISAFAAGAGALNEPPIASCHNVTAPADALCRANVSVDQGSYDPDGDPVTISQNPAAPYGVGTTSVELTISDSFGATASCHAIVTVEDATPPTITAPPDMSVNATGPSGAVVVFSFTADDNCGIASLASAPPSGSTFPINPPGTTTLVVGTATDAANNTATANFHVHVKGAAEQLDDLHAAVIGVPPGNSLANMVTAAQGKLATGDVAGTCALLHALTHEISAQAGKKLTAAQAALFTSTAQRIAAVLSCS